MPWGELEIHKGEMMNPLRENSKSTEGEFHPLGGEMRNPLGEDMVTTTGESKIHWAGIWNPFGECKSPLKGNIEIDILPQSRNQKVEGGLRLHENGTG